MCSPLSICAHIDGRACPRNTKSYHVPKRRARDARKINSSRDQHGRDANPSVFFAADKAQIPLFTDVPFSVDDDVCNTDATHAMDRIRTAKINIGSAARERDEEFRVCFFFYSGWRAIHPLSERKQAMRNHKNCEGGFERSPSPYIPIE